jgi:arabinan endo-1,5-alpha-L-arabinosidase
MRLSGSARLWLCAVACSGCMGSPDIVATVDVPEILPITGSLAVDDPTIATESQQFWIFSTGPGLPAKTSSDLLAWADMGSAFDQAPDWVAREVPNATDLWSPDIAFFGGLFHLYYAASTFGSSVSCIGHATAAHLGVGAWSDQGSVLCSGATDDWNAIDPSVLVTADGDAWLAFGSWLSGIKLVHLDSTGSRADASMLDLAARPDPDMIQAASLLYRNGFYYLFNSFDSCCAGVDSTHKLMVGRATSITGPYLDRAGASLLDGGGTLILQGDTRWRGPGSNDTIVVGDRTYNVYHAYDAQNGGAATLRIATLVWDAAGWPVSGGP